MSAHPLQALVRHVRRIAGAGDPNPLGDAELVARFTISGDQDAFADIVRRHGPLVWAICRTNLNADDADDAFQATFLVLARRAKSIRKPAALACWLSGVARRTISGVRARQMRRREVPLDVDVRSEDSAPAERNEERRLIAAELERLPEKYRLPTLLCYVQGLTNEEAAKRLGWPSGTVCGRLARARDLLRTSLARRGVTLTVAALGTSADRPPVELLAATLRASMATTVTGSTLKLAEAVMHAMWLTKVKMFAGAILTVAVLGAGTGWVMTPVAAQDRPKASKDKPKLDSFAQAPAAGTQGIPPGLPAQLDEAKANEFLRQAIDAVAKPSPLSEAKPNDSALRALVKERHKTAIRELALRLQVFQAGAKGGTIAILLDSAGRTFESEIALGSSAAEKTAATMRAFTIAKGIAAINKVRYEVGQVAQQDLEQSRYYMIGMQIKATGGAESFNANMIGD